jgi:hypothetical protein
VKKYLSGFVDALLKVGSVAGVLINGLFRLSIRAYAFAVFVDYAKRILAPL